MLVASAEWPDLEGEKLLLASIIRRAAYDIAMYRGATRLEHQKLWRDAYDWMFRDPKPVDPDELRILCSSCRAAELGCTPIGGICPAEETTSFLSICSALQTNPIHIRAVTRMMLKKDIKRCQVVDSTHGGEG